MTDATFTKTGWMELMCPVIVRRAGGVHPATLDKEAREAFDGGGHRAWRIEYTPGSLRNMLQKVPVCPCGEKLVLVAEEVR